MQPAADVPSGRAVDAGLSEGFADGDFFRVLARFDDDGGELPGDSGCLVPAADQQHLIVAQDENRRACAFEQPVQRLLNGGPRGGGRVCHPVGDRPYRHVERGGEPASVMRNALRRAVASLPVHSWAAEIVLGSRDRNSYAA
jgi:hypothetical protein